jgi:hypothetical protein
MKLLLRKTGTCTCMMKSLLKNLCPFILVLHSLCVLHVCLVHFVYSVNVDANSINLSACNYVFASYHAYSNVMSLDDLFMLVVAE